MLAAKLPRRRPLRPRAHRRAGGSVESRRAKPSCRRQSLCAALLSSSETRCKPHRTCEGATGTTFAAYGEILAVHGSDGVAVPVTAALTSLGYSGEHFDAKMQQQYLRARWYDPANGRFNRLDPFAGNMQDPQSLHKYLYAHADPVNGIDPSGEFLVGLAISFGSFAFRTGKELGSYAIATTALYSALGGGIGAGAYASIGENSWTGAYNGALIGAATRIAYLSQGGWPGVGKTFTQGAVAGVSRFAVELSFGLYSENINPQGLSTEQIARKAALRGIDSLASGMWAAATTDFISAGAKTDSAKFAVAVLDAGVSSLYRDLTSTPVPPTEEIIDNAIVTAMTAGATSLFKTAWNSNPQIDQSITDEIADEAVTVFGNLMFSFVVGWGSKGAGGLARFLAGR